MITIKGRADADMTRSGERSSRLVLGLGWIPFPIRVWHPTRCRLRLDSTVRSSDALRMNPILGPYAQKHRFPLSGERGLGEHHLGRVSLERGEVLNPWRVAEPSFEFRVNSMHNAYGYRRQ
jgi:hypothetical protein